jgi:hypothetical protein
MRSSIAPRSSTVMTMMSGFVLVAAAGDTPRAANSAHSVATSESVTNARRDRTASFASPDDGVRRPHGASGSLRAFSSRRSNLSSGDGASA